MTVTRPLLTILTAAFLALAYQSTLADPPHPTAITRTGAEDRHAAIQKAIDDLVPLGGGSVYLDGQGQAKPFWVDRPVLLRASNVELYGRNMVSTGIKARGYFSPLVAGLYHHTHPSYRTPDDCWLQSSDLDATAGKRFALRTRKQSFVEFFDSPLDAHDWPAVTEFTVDVAFRCRESGVTTPGVIPICGALNYKSEISPLSLTCFNDGLRLRVNTSTGVHTARANWKPTLGRFYRLRVTCKLGAASGTKVWVGGVAQPMHENPTVTGTMVRRLCNHGWGLGKLSQGSYTWGQSGPHDTEYHGFRVVAGSPPPNDTDLNRYFSKPPGTLVYLPLTENAPADRLVKWETQGVPGFGNPWGFAFFLRPVPGVIGHNVVGRVTVRDLAASPGPFGAGLTVVGGYHVRAERCTLFGGTWSLNSWPYFVSYPVTVKDCELIGGSRANGLLANRWTGTLDNVQFTGYHKNAITALGSNLTIRQCLINGDSPHCDVTVRLLAGQAGGMYKFCDGTLLNNETVAPSEAAVDCHMETVPQNPQTNLVLDGVALGNNGPAGRAYVRLYTGNNPHGNQGSLISIGGSRYNGYPLAQLMGQGWTVTTLGAQPKDTPVKVDAEGKPIAE